MSFEAIEGQALERLRPSRELEERGRSIYEGLKDRIEKMLREEGWKGGGSA